MLNWQCFNEMHFFAYNGSLVVRNVLTSILKRYVLLGVKKSVFYALQWNSWSVSLISQVLYCALLRDILRWSLQFVECLNSVYCYPFEYLLKFSYYPHKPSTRFELLHFVIKYTLPTSLHVCSHKLRYFKQIFYFTVNKTEMYTDTRSNATWF